MRISDWSSDVCSSDLVWLIGISPSFLTLPVPVSLHRGVNAQFDNRAAWIIGGELHIPCDRALNRHQRGPVDEPDGRREARLAAALPSLHCGCFLHHYFAGRSLLFVGDHLHQFATATSHHFVRQL